LAKINSQVPLAAVDWSEVDVCIEFTRPELAPQHIAFCAQKQIPIVVGTTAWQEALAQVTELVNNANSALLYASNFSVGVNIFFEINKTLARLMGNHPGYDVCIREVHHTQKKDAPSGTAITLAEQVLRDIPGKENWVNEVTGQTSDLVISSERINPYPGLHTVRYASSIDEIRITHEAHSRDGFALGAVLAAEFIKDRTGVFSMKDVLGIGD
jgi:4-hydroxy-tetrahydrodipicolinate reductase